MWGELLAGAELLTGFLGGKEAADASWTPEKALWFDRNSQRNQYGLLGSTIYDPNSNSFRTVLNDQGQGLFDWAMGNIGGGSNYRAGAGLLGPDSAQQAAVNAYRSRYGMAPVAQPPRSPFINMPGAGDGADPEVPGGGPGNDNLIGDPLPPNGPDDGANPPGPDLTEPIQNPPTSVVAPPGGINPGAGVGDNPYWPGFGWDNYHNPLGPLPGGDDITTNSYNAAAAQSNLGRAKPIDLGLDGQFDSWQDAANFAADNPRLFDALSAAGLTGAGLIDNIANMWLNGDPDRRQSAMFPDGGGYTNFLDGYGNQDVRDARQRERDFLNIYGNQENRDSYAAEMEAAFLEAQEQAMLEAQRSQGLNRRSEGGGRGFGWNTVFRYNPNGGSFQGSMLPADLDRGDRYDMMPENPFERTR